MKLMEGGGKPCFIANRKYIIPKKGGDAWKNLDVKYVYGYTSLHICIYIYMYVCIYVFP